LNIARCFEATSAPSSPAAADRGVGAKDRPAAAGTGFISRGLAVGQGTTPEERRTRRDSIFAVIRAEIERQGDHMGIERICALAGVSQGGYYQYWRASKPRQEETALRDEIQRMSLIRRTNSYRDGYRPITIQLQRMGWTVNHKRVARIRREDNLLCVPRQAFRLPTTDSRYHWHVWLTCRRAFSFRRCK
jgi:AcrR family transcriptional regulator